MKPFLFCAGLFCLLFIVIDAFNNLDEFLKHGVTVKVVLGYYASLFPSLFVQMVPIAVLVSILFALGHLNRHNEIIAMKASGVNTKMILLPFLFIGLVTSVAILLVSESLVPQSKITSTAIMDGLIKKGKKNFEQRAIKNVALYGSEGRIIFAKEFEVMSQTLYDVEVLEDKSGRRLKTKFRAKKATYEDGRWVFHEVVRYRINQRGDLIGEPQFSQKLLIELKEKPEDFIKEASQIDFMNAKQLREYIVNLKGSSKKLAMQLWVHFHNKIAFPFISLIVVLIGAPLAMRTERGSAMLGIGTSLGIVFGYYAVDSICLALGKGGTLPPFFAAWFSNFIFAGIGFYLIRKSA